MPRAKYVSTLRNNSTDTCACILPVLIGVWVNHKANHVHASYSFIFCESGLGSCQKRRLTASISMEPWAVGMYVCVILYLIDKQNSFTLWVTFVMVISLIRMINSTC